MRDETNKVSLPPGMQYLCLFRREMKKWVDFSPMTCRMWNARTKGFVCVESTDPNPARATIKYFLAILNLLERDV